MAPYVVWTHRAERRLHFALSRAAVADGPTRTAAIDVAVAAAFAGADHVIVLDLYLGFRVRPGEHVLLVDVRDGRPGYAGTFIVKLAAAETLGRECGAWTACRPPAFWSDHVFMKQERRPETADPIVALVYQDAQSHIGADRQMSLEDAFLSAVRFDALKPASLERVLRELFDSLCRNLYRGARVVEPDRIELNWDNTTGRRRPLADSFADWETSGPAGEIRRGVNAAFPSNFADFIDPVDFYRFVVEELDHGVPSSRWIPVVVRGPSHGDLHGRNVLVGVEDGKDEVVHPALFDYEHMAADNLIGWDFVKLETELKIRAYPYVFADQGPIRRYITAVQAFELELAEKTEHHRPNGGWPEPGGDTRRGRLLTLLLSLRRLAGQHLTISGRPDEWLEEYYFLLGCYTVYAVRFKNQKTQERAAVFVSGGVAVARFLWWRKRSSTLSLDEESSSSEEVKVLLAGRYPTYNEPLQVAWGWNRSGDPEKVGRAHTLLMGLRKHYGHILHWEYEIAFNLTKQKKYADALALLTRMGETFHGLLDEDTLALWGKCYKVRGDGFRDAGLRALPGRPERLTALAEAELAYKEACLRYEQAYALDHNWFPGINLATLWLMRAALAGELGRLVERDAMRNDSGRLAGELWKTKDEWRPRLKDDAVWMAATRGEAALLLCKWEEAAAHYGAALAQPVREPHHPNTIKEQVCRIITALDLLGVQVGGPLADPEVFFAVPEGGQDSC